MKILTAHEMGEADRRSVEEGVPVAELMHNAGAAVAEFCLKHFDAHSHGLIVALCGKGNNGGDGMVAARLLAEEGRAVRIVLLGTAGELKDEAADAWRQAKRLERVEIRYEEELAGVLSNAALVIDAVVGTGFKPPLRGLAVTAKEVLASSRAKVVAVDLPSGWDADSVEQKAEAFRADAVVTFEAPKMAHVFGHMTPPDVFGPVVVAPIGTPDDALTSSGELSWAGEAKSVAEKPRGVDGNKGKFGHVLLIGGAVGKAGAPSMASLAAMRAGAGLVTAAVVKDVLPTVAAIAPELMMAELEISKAQLAPERLAKLLKGMTVVGIGPGLGTEPETVEFVREFVRVVELPMVIDADALNALAGQTSILREVTEAAKAKGKPRTIVMTPHPGEMGRLVDKTVKEVEADRLGLARSFAMEHGVTLVLKGWRTLIAHPDGRVAVNTTGNPAMAKGGSGDILTGITSAMLAQYPEDVARAVEGCGVSAWAGGGLCLPGAG